MTNRKGKSTTPGGTQKPGEFGTKTVTPDNTGAPDRKK
jgi:hypothetical protein